MTKPSFSIRSLNTEEAEICEQILRSLPDWFGIEEAIIEYRHDIEAMETYIAEISGELAGFITLDQHNEFSAEIRVMAVRSDYHRLGCGRSLITHTERILISRSVEYLQVKTLGPSRPNEQYGRTRGFYFSLGFRPLEENKLWGEQNPCLIMVKYLRCNNI